MNEKRPSGHELEERAEQALGEAGWIITPNRHYTDPVSQKPRELDLLAEKTFEVYEFTSLVDCFTIRLFISCKHLPVENNLHLRYPNKELIIRGLLDAGIYYNQDLQYPETINHHYLKAKNVFKSWDNLQGNNSDPLFEAFVSAAHALVSLERDQPRSSPRPGHIINFPVVLVDDSKKLETSKVGNTEIDTSASIFLHEWDYKITPTGKSPIEKIFLVDLLGFDKLPEYLTMLEKQDVAEYRRTLSFRHLSDRRQASENQSDSWI